MKLLIRILLLSVVILSVMLIIYPAAHESGHILAAVIVGEPIVGVGFFPAAYTQVAPDEVSFIGLTLLCFGGAGFPLLLLLIPGLRNGYLYFAKLTVALITAAAALVSFADILGIDAFGDAAYDDASLILRFYPERHTEVAVMLLLLFTAAALFIVLTGPLKKTAVFFENTLSGRQRGVVEQRAEAGVKE